MESCCGTAIVKIKKLVDLSEQLKKTKILHIFDPTGTIRVEQFKQFISRRRVPQRVLSDNTTNFKGDSHMLLSEVEKISLGELESNYTEIEWIFI